MGVSSDWSWTVGQRAVRDLEGLSDRSLRNALVGWRGLPDDLEARMAVGRSTEPRVRPTVRSITDSPHGRSTYLGEIDSVA